MRSLWETIQLVCLMNILKYNLHFQFELHFVLVYRKGSRAKHIRSSHIKNTYICDFCGKNYQTKDSIILHMNQHITDSNFVCTICGLTFGNVLSFRRHTRTQHGQLLEGMGAKVRFAKRYKVKEKKNCLLCKIDFKTYSECKQHMKVISFRILQENQDSILYSLLYHLISMQNPFSEKPYLILVDATIFVLCNSYTHISRRLTMSRFDGLIPKHLWSAVPKLNFQLTRIIPLSFKMIPCWLEIIIWVSLVFMSNSDKFLFSRHKDKPHTFRISMRLVSTRIFDARIVGPAPFVSLKSKTAQMWWVWFIFHASRTS